MNRRAFANVDWWEHRPDRSYDEQDPSGLVMPDGSIVASFDRAFLVAATVEVLALHAVWCGVWAGEGHRFEEHDESPQGPRRAVYCECGAQPGKEAA